MLKRDYTQELINVVHESYEKHKDWDVQKLYTRIKDDVYNLLWIDKKSLTKYNIKQILWMAVWDIEERREVIEQLNNEVKKVEKYQVSDNHYIFTLQEWKMFPIEIELVDQIFYDYSEKGWNMSADEVSRKYKLRPEVWIKLKNALWLYKKSHTLSPVSMERMSDNELDEHIDKSINEHIYDKYTWRFINSYEKLKEKDYIKKSKILANIDNFLEHMQSYIEWYKPIEFNWIRDENNNFTNNTLDVWFWDIHLWKAWSDEVISRIETLMSYLKWRPEKYINLISFWDMVETLVEWWMHPWQIENMDWIYWFDLILQTANILEQLLLWLYKAGKEVRFIWLWGNHDRLWKSNQEDIARTWALMIYELVKRWLKDIDIQIDYIRESHTSIDLGNFNYIIEHGDLSWFPKRKVEDILWKNWIVWRYNIIMHWHLHNISISETMNATKIGIPGLAWAWEYDSRLDLHSEPWVVLVTKNEQWTPDIMVKRL